jgi:DNA polymerase V
MPGQSDLFDVATNKSDGKQLMKAVDRINRRFPKAISVAATGFDNTWKAKAERISQCYTTDWRELACVRCC